MTVVFPNVPLPPSSNHQYRSFVRGKRIMHVTAPETVLFKKAMDHYFTEYSRSVVVAKCQLVGKPLAVHIRFDFEVSRLLTKKGTFKRLDVSNRLKAIHDCFAKALEIDDSHFVFISAEKRGVKSKLSESCRVEISDAAFVTE